MVAEVRALLEMHVVDLHARLRPLQPVVVREHHASLEQLEPMAVGEDLLDETVVVARAHESFIADGFLYFFRRLIAVALIIVASV